MYGPDKFEDPTSSSQSVQFEDESILAKAKGAVGPLKKNSKKIIAAAVVLIVAVFAYNYFIASVKEVTLAVSDTEGKALDNSSIKVFAEGSEEPIFSDSENSSYKLSLRIGKYRVEARAPEYSAAKESIDIGEKDNSIEITLVKNINVDIVDFEAVFPKQLIAGETRQVTVQLKNKSNSTLQPVLVPEGDLRGMMSNVSATIAPNATQTVTLAITVPDSIEIKDQKIGDAKTASLRVQYTKEKASAKFTLMPNPGKLIEINGVEFSVKAVEGYNKQAKEITVNNKNPFPLEGLTLSVEITDSEKNPAASVLRWFKFSEIADQPDPWKITIGRIEAKKSAKKELMVDIPLSAKKELDIKGNIVLGASYLPQEIKKTMTLDITQEAGYGITIALSPKPPYQIAWNSAIGKYEEKSITMSVKNSGQIPLSNFLFTIGNATSCSTDWLELLEYTVDSLEKGGTAAIRMKATAPLAQRGNESTMHCNLAYSYDDPIVLGSKVDGAQADFAQVAPEPG